MALDDFLRECRRTGATPLRYSQKTKRVDGEYYEEYINSGFVKEKERLREKYADLFRSPGLGDREEEEEGKEKEKMSPTELSDMVSKFYNKDIVIHTKQGYHYGTLRDCDGKMLYLEGYLFDKKLIDSWQYSSDSFFSEPAIVPASDIISIQEIPSHVDNYERFLDSLFEYAAAKNIHKKKT